jgi:hypothetical protein
MTFTGPQGIILHETVLYITTTARTSNPSLELISTATLCVKYYNFCKFKFNPLLKGH